jgi:hypothetical protein
VAGVLSFFSRMGVMITTLLLAARVAKVFALPLPLRRREEQEVMFHLQKREFILLTAFIVAGAIAYGVYRQKRDYGGPKPT